MSYSPKELLIIASNYEKITCETTASIFDRMIDKYGQQYMVPTNYAVKDMQTSLQAHSPNIAAILHSKGWGGTGVDGQWGQRTEQAFTTWAHDMNLPVETMEDREKAAVILMTAPSSSQEAKKEQPAQQEAAKPAAIDDTTPNQWANTIRFTTMTVYNQLFTNYQAGEITPQTANVYITMIQTNKGIIDPYTEQLEIAIKDSKYSQEDRDKWRKIIDDAYATINNWLRFLQNMKRQPAASVAPQPLAQPSAQPAQQATKQPAAQPTFNPNEPAPAQEPDDDSYYAGGEFYSPGGGWLWDSSGRRWKRNRNRSVPPGGTKGHKAELEAAKPTVAPRQVPRQVARPTVGPSHPSGFGGGHRGRR